MVKVKKYKAVYVLGWRFGVDCFKKGLTVMAWGQQKVVGGLVHRPQHIGGTEQQSVISF